MTGALSGSSMLVGRDAEMERADLLVEGIFSGSGALMLINGEAGIGKSALVSAIAERAQQRGARFALGCCYETGVPAFASWQQLLRELRLTGLNLDQLPAPFGIGTTSRTAYELMQTVTRALVEASRQEPLVLCIDDVHWADRDTLELLWFVSRELRSAAILMLATFR